jgi:hypothetical protein
MGMRLVKGFFNAIASMTWLVCIFYLVVLSYELSDLDNFKLPFQIASPFVLSDFLAPYWPKQILISILIFVLFLAICSNKAAALIGKIRISGNLLVPALLVAYIALVVVFILFSDVTYPTRLRDGQLFPILLVAWCSIIYIPLLVFLNCCLPKPSSGITFAVFLVALFGPSYLALFTWLNYLQSGEIDVSQALKLVI